MEEWKKWDKILLECVSHFLEKWVRESAKQTHTHTERERKRERERERERNTEKDERYFERETIKEFTKRER